MDSIEVVVVGAGVVGLAVARTLAEQGREVLILEALDAFGTETSARNSEVIHAGIYYPRGSLKARLCVAGRELLYAFCDRYGVPHRRCGKLIVATSASQFEELQKIQAAARANGVELELIERNAALKVEPQLSCVGALHSSVTGIVDSHAYMLALLGQAEAAGAMLAYRSRLSCAWLESDCIKLAINDAVEPSIRTRWLINSAGLFAPQCALMLEGFPSRHIPRAYFAKGNYFTLSGRSPFARLVYPIPEPGGLGVHLTLDLAGQARFGPDVEWLEPMRFPIDYAVDSRRGESFYNAIRTYWPALPDGALMPAYSGMRPKISAPNEPAADFRIDGPAYHGVSGVVNLFGIESPGLTASLAIAGEVARKVNGE